VKGGKQGKIGGKGAIPVGTAPRIMSIWVRSLHIQVTIEKKVNENAKDKRPESSKI